MCEGVTMCVSVSKMFNHFCAGVSPCEGVRVRGSVSKTTFNTLLC